MDSFSQITDRSSWKVYFAKFEDKFSIIIVITRNVRVQVQVHIKF